MANREQPRTDHAPLVLFDAVTLRVGGEDVFPDTTWSIGRDEQWAVIGPNGCGKSTLLRAISGEIPVSRGEIKYRFAGNAVRAFDIVPPSGAIGYVSTEQHRALVTQAIEYHQARWSHADGKPPTQVSEILWGERCETRSRADQRLLKRLDIRHLVTRGIQTLSNGEMRKVLIARALIRRPKLLVLDDPFAGLDHGTRKRLMSLLCALMDGGCRIVIATPRFEEIPSRVTHLLLVLNQRVVLQAPKRRVLKDPAVTQMKDPPLKPIARPALVWRVLSRGSRNVGPVLVEMHNVNVVYDDAAILRNVSWIIRRGEAWVLRGPNGAGKTTLLSLILGDNPQVYANDVRLFGIQRGSGESLWEIRKHIGWFAPELQFHYCGDATCFEVVASGLYDTVGLYHENSPRERRAVRQWMNNMGAWALADEPFGGLPDHLQRMVLLARALVKEPPLLILDEPCQGLDTAHRHTVLNILDRIARRPESTIVYVTHHADEIPSSFTHELLMLKGKVTHAGRRRAK